MRRYLTGFLFSVLLTLFAYEITVLHMDSRLGFIPHELTIPLVLMLAFVQLFVQLYYFLHLEEKESRWNLFFFSSTISLILLVVVGSLWIMGHLEYSHEALEEAGDVMMHQEGLHK